MRKQRGEDRRGVEWREEKRRRDVTCVVTVAEQRLSQSQSGTQYLLNMSWRKWKVRVQGRLGVKVTAADVPCRARPHSRRLGETTEENKRSTG